MRIEVRENRPWFAAYAARVGRHEFDRSSLTGQHGPREGAHRAWVQGFCEGMLVMGVVAVVVALCCVPSLARGEGGREQYPKQLHVNRAHMERNLDHFFAHENGRDR